MNEFQIIGNDVKGRQPLTWLVFQRPFQSVVAVGQNLREGVEPRVRGFQSAAIPIARRPLAFDQALAVAPGSARAAAKPAAQASERKAAFSTKPNAGFPRITAQPITPAEPASPQIRMNSPVLIRFLRKSPLDTPGRKRQKEKSWRFAWGEPPATTLNFSRTPWLAARRV